MATGYILFAAKLATSVKAEALVGSRLNSQPVRPLEGKDIDVVNNTTKWREDTNVNAALPELYREDIT